MTSYNIQDIATILKGQLIKESGGKVSYLLIDSRKILFPRESLFIALRGLRNDGHLFLADLYKAGVRNFIVEKYPEERELFSRANFLKVDNSFEALQQLVIWHRSSIKIPVLGVTGSNGKTIVKEWIYQCLSPEKYVIRNPKSFNSQVGVPLSVWHLTPEADLGIFEAGLSQPGEMEVLQRIIQPTLGIFTNIGDAHQENFTSLEQKIDEKLKLFSQVETLVYCSDQELVHSKIEILEKKGIKLFSWGESYNANLRISQIVHQKNQTVITGTYKNESVSIKIPFTDKASVENAIHTWCFMLLIGFSHDFIALKMSKLENIAMRLELKEGNNQCTLINDSYNSDLESLHIALDFLSYQNQHRYKILILSDIAQSGYPKNELYQLVANVVKQKKIDRLIGIGSDISEFGSLFELRKDFFSTTNQFLESNEWQKLHDCTILLKGARVFAFEQIGQLLQKQNHRTIFEIDLNAIEYNLNYFKKLLKPTTGIVAMLKASGYGSGTHEIANLCQYQRVAAIAVAFPDEGIELRNHGIKTPIWVMNPEEESFYGMIENQLEPQIYSFRSLMEFNKMAGQSASRPFPIHIKLDTGMHRSGFLKEDIPELLELLKQSEHVKVATLLSHLASADEPEQDDFTMGQIHLFEEISRLIMQQFSYPIKRHILNSAGIERFPEYQFDLVRLGIGMYGISSINATLAQAGTLTSSIIQLKKIKKGQTVGYSRKGKVMVDSVIATVPVGYADGLRRILSNGVGKIWLNNQLAPIIGNVCMDMCMIDVTGMEVNEGDRVEIFGEAFIRFPIGSMDANYTLRSAYWNFKQGKTDLSHGIMVIEPSNDAMGLALTDYLKKRKVHKLRIDSNISETDEIPVSYLFRDFTEMPSIEQTALNKCRGNVLDVGGAAGSHSIWLQNKGIQVTALDISGLACEVMKQRGVREVVLKDFFEFQTRHKYDTLLFLMNGIGICGSLDRLPVFFSRCKSLLAPGGQILLDSSDLIYMFGDDEEGYILDLNGAYYGEVEYVMRYGKVKSNPFNWLFVDPDTLARYALEEGFSCDIVLEGNHYDYLAFLALKR